MTTELDELQHFFAAAPFMVELGVVPKAVSDDGVTTELALAPRHRQHTGRVHAGVMVSMADHTMGAAAQRLAADGFVAITAELSTRLLRAASGERLLCSARVIKRGRQISFTEADVFCECAGQRTLVAKASATMALVAIDAST